LTVAQLVYPASGLLHLRRAGANVLDGRAAHRFWSGGAALWRAIGLGLGFALIGMAMMVGVIGAAGVASHGPQPRVAAPVAALTAPGHRLEIYQDPAEALTGALPVP
jgi:hypothetical protein